jgi:hypothetical protein
MMTKLHVYCTFNVHGFPEPDLLRGSVVCRHLQN